MAGFEEKKEGLAPVPEKQNLWDNKESSISSSGMNLLQHLLSGKNYESLDLGDVRSLQKKLIIQKIQRSDSLQVSVRISDPSRVGESSSLIMEINPVTRNIEDFRARIIGKEITGGRLGNEEVAKVLLESSLAKARDILGIGQLDMKVVRAIFKAKGIEFYPAQLDSMELGKDRRVSSGFTGFEVKDRHGKSVTISVNPKLELVYFQFKDLVGEAATAFFDYQGVLHSVLQEGNPGSSSKVDWTEISNKARGLLEEIELETSI